MVVFFEGRRVHPLCPTLSWGAGGREQLHKTVYVRVVVFFEEPGMTYHIYIYNHIYTRHQKTARCRNTLMKIMMSFCCSRIKYIRWSFFYAMLATSAWWYFNRYWMVFLNAKGIHTRWKMPWRSSWCDHQAGNIHASMATSCGPTLSVFFSKVWKRTSSKVFLAIK